MILPIDKQERAVTDILQVLRIANDASLDEAKEYFEDIRDRLNEAEEDPDDILAEYNLEPDYLFEFL